MSLKALRIYNPDYEGMVFFMFLLNPQYSLVLPSALSKAEYGDSN